MSTPHGPPKSNVIDFSNYTFLRARASGNNKVDSSASQVDISLKFDLATDTCRNLYEDIPFYHHRQSLVQPTPNEDDSED